MEKNLIIVSGPSGVGKSTLLKRLFSEHGDKVSFSVSYTSRYPREGEVDGKDYFFVSESVFKSNIDAGEFVEWALVHGNYYGTSKKEVERILSTGKHCILDIDVQGAMQVKESGIDSMYIFIAPENLEVLKQRLVGRGTETSATIEKRLKNAEKELTHKEKYDYIIINDDIDRSYRELESCIINLNK